MTLRHLPLLAALLLSTGCAQVEVRANEAPLPEPRISHFLLFQDGRASEAMTFYAGLFEDGEVLLMDLYGPDEAGAEGAVKLAKIRIGGLLVRSTDSPPIHEFGFTPSTSLFVECRDEAELDRLAAALSDGGSFLMPPADYGFSRKFAWVQDRYGVSWQLILPYE